MANGESIDPTTIAGWSAAVAAVIGSVATVLKLLNSDSSQFRKDILGRLGSVEKSNRQLERRLDDEQEKTRCQNDLLRVLLGKLKEVMLGSNALCRKHGEAEPYKPQDWDYAADLDAIDRIGKDRPRESVDASAAHNRN